MKGIDCATPLTTALAAQFAADGIKFVCRYLVPSGWKRLTRAEAEVISTAGLQIVSVFEASGDRASILRSKGYLDGGSALISAKEIGQPFGSVIYFAIDYEAADSDMDNIEAYLCAAASQIPGYVIGVYGSLAVVEAMHTRGACSHFWQTVSWSQGKKSAAANIYQSRIDTTLHGIGVDLNDSYGNEGSWNTLGVQPMTKVDADKVIAFLKAAYGATNDAQAHADIKHLGDEMRRVSGQAIQN